jgi:UDP-2,4-diacetamido-2,4,6-trideoxy-beta-L-altropyranose hydrolase
MGTGHAMRCLALAQGWRHAGAEVFFALAESTAAVDALLRSEKFNVTRVESVPGSGEDARNTLELARARGADWFVVDGYHFGAGYQAQLQSLRPVLAVDDNGLLDYYTADLVLNQNAHACTQMYPHVSPNTKLLLGPRFALLRDEFVAYQEWVREIPEQGTRLLVTMGGSDPANFTPRILPFLAQIPNTGLQIRVVVGGSAENAKAVDEIAASFVGRVEVLRDVRNMAELMAWADVAISGAGTTCWEMCCLGLPAFLVVVADNQRFIAEQLEARGAVENAGGADHIAAAALAKRCRQLLANKDKRVAMSQSARKVVDGDGRDRVLNMMKCGDEMCV